MCGTVGVKRVVSDAGASLFVVQWEELSFGMMVSVGRREVETGVGCLCARELIRGSLSDVA